VTYDQGPDPTPRADIDVRRERTGIYLRGKAGPLEGEMRVSTDSPGDSAAANAVTMLLVVMTAFISGGLATGIFWLAHISGYALALVGLGVFTAVFVTGAIFAFRRVSRTDRTPLLRSVIIRDDAEDAVLPNGADKPAPAQVEGPQLHDRGRRGEGLAPGRLTQHDAD
jgi:hypothetical protein